VSQLERCVTNISVDGLERLAIALGVDVLELLAPIETSKPDARNARQRTTARSRR